MTTIKNVVLAGAAGNLGTAILASLTASNKFNITVFSRSGSTSKFPTGTKVVEVDYSSVESLTSALAGQDALISAFASLAVGGQNNLIDAALAAGVKRFLPSEFGSNLSNPKTRALPVFAMKVSTQEYLVEKCKNSSLSYTLVHNGPFLDWGLQVGFLVNTADGKPTLFDGGDLPFSTTTLSSVGDAVVGVLSHFDETKNRTVYVQNMVTTQNKILALAKKVAPNKNWEPKVVMLDELTAASDQRLKQHLYDQETFMPYLFRAIFDPACGGLFEKNDNELLGVKALTDADVEQMLSKILK